jgi:hypothetical protein
LWRHGKDWQKKDLLPKEMGAAIGKQILGVAGTIRKNRS